MLKLFYCYKIFLNDQIFLTLVKSISSKLQLKRIIKIMKYSKKYNNSD